MALSESNKSAFPRNVSASQYTVTNIWEKFIGTGELNYKRLRPVIADSWLRCRKLGIDPLNSRARTVISKEEIEAKLHTENLGVAGKNVLDKMSSTVDDSRHAIVLADNSGRILYSVGHKQIENKLEKINFRPGAEWKDDRVGPNGIGTVLAFEQPELVMGSEHFCQGWKHLVCYGAPIHNPSNHSVLGCVDITGPADKVSVEAMALTISITQSIESDLSILQLTKREKLRQAYSVMQLKMPNDASLIVDEYGYIIDINSHANELLNASSSLINQPVDLYLPSLSNIIDICINSNIEKECELELEKALTDKARLLLKPIMVSGERLGCFISILGGKQIYNDTTSLRSNEDELIKQTLLQTNGNISKAARILNIDRATIYRRRKNWN